MPAISKLEFQQWKEHPVTKAYFEASNVRIEDAKEILAVQAGMNPDEDNFFRGFIRAYREMLDFTIDFYEDEE